MITIEKVKALKNIAHIASEKLIEEVEGIQNIKSNEIMTGVFLASSMIVASFLYAKSKATHVNTESIIDDFVECIRSHFKDITEHHNGT